MGKEDKKAVATRHVVYGTRAFARGVYHLVRQPIFLALTLVGNSFIVMAASALYFVENGANPHIHSFLDCLWWAVATATTVGYGDISPVTVPGKILGMGMMLLGTTLFCSFTAFFASALLSPEIRELGEDVLTDEQEVEKHLTQIQSTLQQVLVQVRKRRSV